MGAEEDLERAWRACLAAPEDEDAWRQLARSLDQAGRGAELGERLGRLFLATRGGRRWRSLYLELMLTHAGVLGDPGFPSMGGEVVAVAPDGCAVLVRRDGGIRLLRAPRFEGEGLPIRFPPDTRWAALEAGGESLLCQLRMVRPGRGEAQRGVLVRRAAEDGRELARVVFLAGEVEPELRVVDLSREGDALQVVVGERALVVPVGEGPVDLDAATGTRSGWRGLVEGLVGRRSLEEGWASWAVAHGPAPARRVAGEVPPDFHLCPEVQGAVVSRRQIGTGFYPPGPAVDGARVRLARTGQALVLPDRRAGWLVLSTGSGRLLDLAAGGVQGVPCASLGRGTPRVLADGAVAWLADAELRVARPGAGEVERYQLAAGSAREAWMAGHRGRHRILDASPSGQRILLRSSGGLTLVDRDRAEVRELKVFPGLGHAREEPNHEVPLLRARPSRSLLHLEAEDDLTMVGFFGAEDLLYCHRPPQGAHSVVVEPLSDTEREGRMMALGYNENVGDGDRYFLQGTPHRTPVRLPGLLTVRTLGGKEVAPPGLELEGSVELVLPLEWGALLLQDEAQSAAGEATLLVPGDAGPETREFRAPLPPGARVAVSPEADEAMVLVGGSLSCWAPTRGVRRWADSLPEDEAARLVAAPGAAFVAGPAGYHRRSLPGEGAGARGGPAGRPEEAPAAASEEAPAGLSEAALADPSEAALAGHSEAALAGPSEAAPPAPRLGTRNLFRLACREVFKDGSVDPEERRFLQRLQQLLRVPPELASRILHAARSGTLASPEEGALEPVELYAQACRLAWADGVLEPREQAILEALGELLGLPCKRRVELLEASRPES